MPKGAEIIVSSNPKGVYLEGTIGDTSKPGTIMQIQPATAPQGGRPFWIKAAPTADGQPVMQAVLLPDSDQGQLSTTPYVAGTRCFLYVPAAGEEMNILAGVSGSTTFTIGDKLMLNGTTSPGAVIPAVAAAASVPWQMLETITVTAPALVYAIATGV